VVERCLALLENAEAPRVVDVGTGTGAIALAIKHELPDAVVTATDVSSDALALAAENAAANGLHVELVQADLLGGIDGPIDLVVSNPPYVLPGELDVLEPEVRDWEPRTALVDEGQTERLVREATRLLDGWLVLEVHAERARWTVELLEAGGYDGMHVTLDLAGRERIVEGRWTS
jgi:release factor glutamine methyltransferase